MKAFESYFANVIGYEKEKEQLYRLCDIAKNPGKYASLGVRLPRGVLLHGEPGLGKTLMATDLVAAMGRKSYILRKDKANDEFVETIGKVFAEAKKNAPSVIFLDDLDKFSSDSDSRNPEELIAVQSGIDSVKEADVFVVATANEFRSLPYALRRPGRFDIILEISAPDRRDAVEIVRHYLSDKKIASDISVESIARLLDGSSCAALESILNEAGIYAGYENCTEIGRNHIIRAALRTVFSAEESVNAMPLAEKQEIAFHEAGHAAAALAYDPEGVGLISVRPTKGETRGVTQVFKPDGYFGSYEKMRQRVVMLLSGRAAVELKFGIIDVGAAPTTASIPTRTKTPSPSSAAPCLPASMRTPRRSCAIIGRSSKSSPQSSSKRTRSSLKTSSPSRKKRRKRLERGGACASPPNFYLDNAVRIFPSVCRKKKSIFSGNSFKTERAAFKLLWKTVFPFIRSPFGTLSFCASCGTRVSQDRWRNISPSKTRMRNKRIVLKGGGELEEAF